MSAIVVKLDRFAILSTPSHDRGIPTLDGFETVRDSFVHRQTTVSTYARCKQLKSRNSDMKIYWQYQPQNGWLEEWKVTMVADDKLGLQTEEILSVLDACPGYRFLLVEIAIDFELSIGVDEKFVRKHATFGKSRAIRRRRDIPILHYGTRKGDKFIRCYRKNNLGVYRVEEELHGGLLRRNGINAIEDFASIPRVIHPKHCQFVDIDWRRLNKHLKSQLAEKCHAVQMGVSKRSASLQRTSRYLRRKGVSNPHRFRIALPINKQVARALNIWANHFKKELSWARKK